MNATFSTASASFLFVLACSSIHQGPPQDVVVLESETDQHPALSFASGEGRAFGGQGNGFTVMATNDFTFGLTRNGNKVVLDASERSPTDRQHHAWNATAATAYEVVSVCARHANEFYVYGIFPSGDTVLERWDLQPAASGAYYTEKESSKTPVGTPTTANRLAIRYVPPFVPPPLRPVPVLSRTRLSSPIASETVAEIEVDPDGRFIVFRLVDDGGLSTLMQYDFATGNQVVIASGPSEPYLSSATSMVFLDSTGIGRILLVDTVAGNAVLFLDTQNDGVFEGKNYLAANEVNIGLPPLTTIWYP